MRIFFSHSSHSSHYKPLLRELRAKLPEHINAWIDEDRLLVGDDLPKSLELAISKDSDFVVLFIDERATQSAWVKREIEWALAVERSLGRTFVLPVVLDRNSWEQFEPADLRKRKCLSCYDFSEQGVNSLAQGLSGQLFAWLSRDVERAKIIAEPEEHKDVLDDADRFVRTVANEIRTIVHPYREQNPLYIDDLMARMRSLDEVAHLNRDQFVDLLTRLQRNSLLTGLYFDGEEIYVEEEHFTWKIEAFKDSKKKIARAACRMIRNGSTVGLDGGSTTALIAQQLARNIIVKRLSALTVITNSVPAASELLRAAGELGLEDDDKNLRVLLAGGRVRPSTMAIVSIESDAGANLRQLIEHVGGVDLAFVGTNGVCADGFTTRTLEESQTKQALLASASSHVIVTDPSKFGLRQHHLFAPLRGAQILTSKEGYETAIQKFEPTLDEAGATLTFA